MKASKQVGSAALALLLTTAMGRAASMTVPAGATIFVRMTDALDSKTNRSGETFRATVDSPVTVDGKIVVPKGAEVIGRVTDVESSGRIKGRPMISVELTALNFGGKSVAIRTSAYQEGGASRGRQSAKIAVGGTIVGTILGFVGGAPWIGTGLGAAAGMVVQTVRRPGQIRIPAESLLPFTLQSPLPLSEGM